MADEVANVKVIAYNKKRQVVVKRTSNKRRLTLDSAMVISTEETLFGAKLSKVSELLEARMDISSATIDREK
jgi:hypothetical protein